jgi:hypothetical protein
LSTLRLTVASATASRPSKAKRVRKSSRQLGCVRIRRLSDRAMSGCELAAIRIAESLGLASGEVLSRIL